MPNLTKTIAAYFADLSEVEAVTINREHEDRTLQLIVYSRGGKVSSEARRRLIVDRASYADFNDQFWEISDGWIDGSTYVKVVYKDVHKTIDEVVQVMVACKARVGYTTTTIHELLNARVFDDRGGWFSELLKTAQQPYPDALVQAIIEKNHPILRNKLTSYIHQLQEAVEQNDLVRVNHRTSHLLASYFDILFAVNRMHHPGAIQTLQYAETHCEKTPSEMRTDIEVLIEGGIHVVERAHVLVDGLDKLLVTEGLLAATE